MGILLCTLAVLDQFAVVLWACIIRLDVPGGVVVGGWLHKER